VIYDCKGIESNWNYVANLIQNNDIIYLNEHHIHKWDKKLITLLANQDKEVHSINATRKGQRGRFSSGLAWFIPRKWKKFTRFFDISSRINAMLIDTGKTRYLFLGVYLSSDNNKDDSYSNELATLTHTIRRFKNEDTKIMLLGDINADLDRFVRGVKEYINDKLFYNWITETKQHEDIMNLTNIYTQMYPNTFKNSRGQHSKIDMCFTIGQAWAEIECFNITISKDERLALSNSGPNWQKVIESAWDVDNGSDHRPLHIVILMNFDYDTVQMMVKVANAFRLNWNKRRHVNVYLDELNKTLETVMAINFDAIDDYDAECNKLYESLKGAILNAFDKACAVKKGQHT
jgi:hypothetical protein